MADFIPHKEPDWATHPRQVRRGGEQGSSLVEKENRSSNGSSNSPNQSGGAGSGKRPPQKRKKKRKGAFDRVFPVLIVILVCILAFAGYKVYDTLSEYKAAADEYDGLAERFTSESSTDDGIEYVAGTSIPLPEYINKSNEKEAEENAATEGNTEASESPKPQIPSVTVDASGASTSNNSYSAWLYMKDAGISYPVVQDDGSDFYLHHTFEGQSNFAGCLYIGPDASKDFSARNTFIFGHNMKDGSMFGGLRGLYNNPSRLTDPYFYLNVNGTWKAYRIFAMTVVRQDSSLFRIPAEDSYSSYVYEVIQASPEYHNAAAYGIAEKHPIVTLSTCYGGTGTQYRLLVFGVQQ